MGCQGIFQISPFLSNWQEIPARERVYKRREIWYDNPDNSIAGNSQVPLAARRRGENRERGVIPRQDRCCDAERAQYAIGILPRRPRGAMKLSQKTCLWSAYRFFGLKRDMFLWARGVGNHAGRRRAMV